MKKVLLLGTNNPGKLKELRALLGGLIGVELVTPADLNLRLEIPERGASYAENAAIKARAFARASGMVTLGDDSGLEVDALNGAPGMFSARYSPKPGATDADRRAYLLENLAGYPRPWSARFRCHIAVASPASSASEVELRLAAGVCEGQVIPEERGTGGFGYDPIFLLAGRELTMAELGEAEKNRLSHRARAVEAALPILREVLGL